MYGSMREGDKPCGWDPDPPAPVDRCPLSLPECRWVTRRKVGTPGLQVRGAQLMFELIGLILGGLKIFVNLCFKPCINEKGETPQAFSPTLFFNISRDDVIFRSTKSFRP